VKVQHGRTNDANSPIVMSETLSPEASLHVELAETLAAAQREATALRLRLQSASELAVGPDDRRVHVAKLRDDLTAAEAKCEAARLAIREADRAAREARDRAREAWRAEILEQARGVVRELLPHVERVDALNGRLETLRARLGNTGEVPASFRPHLLTVARWLEHARRFADDAVR
jgi:chromosome segregation ATPase